MKNDEPSDNVFLGQEVHRLVGEGVAPEQAVVEARKKTEARKRAQQLIDKGYYQISAQYRTLARLPEGLTGRQALAAASDDPEWAGQLGESSAGDQFLRCYSKDLVGLDNVTFSEFKRLGGGTYDKGPHTLELDEQLRETRRELEAMKQRCMALARQLRLATETPVPQILAGQIGFLRESFRNDGAEGETVWAVAETAEKLARRDVNTLAQGIRLAIKEFDPCVRNHICTGCDTCNPTYRWAYIEGKLQALIETRLSSNY